MISPESSILLTNLLRFRTSYREKYIIGIKPGWNTCILLHVLRLTRNANNFWILHYQSSVKTAGLQQAAGWDESITFHEVLKAVFDQICHYAILDYEEETMHSEKLISWCNEIFANVLNVTRRGSLYCANIPESLPWMPTGMNMCSMPYKIPELQ